MSTTEQLNDVARLLRIHLADGPSHVVVSDLGMAGQWLEIQRGDFYFTAGDQNALWGVTTFTKRPNDAEGSFAHQFENMPIMAYWMSNREDGPDGDSATADEIMAYLLPIIVPFQGDAPLYQEKESDMAEQQFRTRTYTYDVMVVEPVDGYGDDEDTDDKLRQVIHMASTVDVRDVELVGTSEDEDEEDGE